MESRYRGAKLGIVYVGLSTVESIPLYHCCPGGTALHLVAYSPAGPDVSRCNDFAVFSEVYTPSLLGPALKEVNPEPVLSLAKAWGANVILVEAASTSKLSGLEEFLVGLRTGDIALGLRSLGILEVDPALLDFGVIDVGDYCNPALAVSGTDLDKYMDRARELGVMIELHAYAKEPLAERFLGLANVSASHMYPLHVNLLEHKGGGAVRDLYTRLRSINPYTYVHVSLYSEEITYCPRCGSPVAYRQGGVLKDLELAEGIRCWRCGQPLNFKLVKVKKTPEPLARLLNGRVKWYDPRAIGRL